jgi:hypothetical protein
MTDLEKGYSMDTGQWRYTRMLANHFIETKQFKKALKITSGYFSKNRDNYIIGMLNAKTFLLNNKFEECISVLKSINILPYEGATDGRQLWREAFLLSALENIKSREYNTAITDIDKAKDWPANLGVGKPYQPDIDERLEDWMKYFCYLKMNDQTKSASALKRIIEFNQTGFGFNYFLTVLAHKKTGDEDKAVSLMNEWEKAEPENDIRKLCVRYLTGNRFSVSDSLLKELNLSIFARLINL